MLIFIIGLPGTGKTTIAKWISEKEHIQHISTEALRADYLGVCKETKDCDFSDEQQLIVYSLMVERARSIINREGAVIVEGVYRSKEQRKAIYNLFSEYNMIKHYFCITCDEQENKRRVVCRKNEGTASPAGIIGFEKIKGEFVFPDSNEPFIMVDNTFCLSETKKVIEKYISEGQKLI